MQWQKVLLSSIAFQQGTSYEREENNQLPIVLWHGLGDSYNSITKIIQDMYPGIYVYSIYVDENSLKDRRASLLGSVEGQISQVCNEIQSNPIFYNGFDAIGFSQGGQFLRGLVQTCDQIKMRNLITWRSQHNGIASLPPCGTIDFTCKSVTSLAKANMWSQWVSTHIVPAQYYRNPSDLETYLLRSTWLADINNERGEKWQVYKERLKALSNFVLVMFEKDSIVIPKWSSLFAEFNETENTVTPLQQRQIYREDWLGLKEMDENGKLHLITVPGNHLNIKAKTFIDIVKRYRNT